MAFPNRGRVQCVPKGAGGMGVGTAVGYRSRGVR